MSQASPFSNLVLQILYHYQSHFTRIFRINKRILRDDLYTEPTPQKANDNNNCKKKKLFQMRHFAGFGPVWTSISVFKKTIYHHYVILKLENWYKQKSQTMQTNDIVQNGVNRKGVR